MKKRLLSILLVLLMALTLLPLGALADSNNKKCGENLTWEFADGILTISGTCMITAVPILLHGANIMISSQVSL